MVKIEHRKQQGTILILLGFALIVLLGMAGLVIDLSRLYVNKTELQSAMDSCALAAAQELDGANDATARAINAGLTAGNANKVNYQKTSAQLISSDITFSDALNGAYSNTFSPAPNAKYAKCTHSTTGIAAYMIQQVGGSKTNAVGATAIATLAHAQTLCPIPIGAVPNGGSAPNYGFKPGQWFTVHIDNSTPGPGEFGVENLDGTPSAKSTKDEMADPGYCKAKIGDPIRTPGEKTSMDDEWNRRFGIYKNNASPSAMPPDFTGYAYTSKNWKNPSPQNAYSGTPAPGSDPTAANFKTKRLGFYNYASNLDNNVSTGNTITGLNIGGGYQNLATGGPSNQLYIYGRNERIVVVPVVSTASTIQDFLCVLMLQPIDSSNPSKTSQFEFIGNAGAAGSPCSTSGLPGGGSSGPLVAALVQ